MLVVIDDDTKKVRSISNQVCYLLKEKIFP